MVDEAAVLAQSQNAEAVNSVAVSEEARQRANEAMMEKVAQDIAASLKRGMPDAASIGEAVSKAVQREMDPEKGRFVDISKVKLICQAVIGIEHKLAEIIETSKQVKRDLDNRLDEKYVTKEAFEPFKKQVESGNDNTTWVVRIVVGAVIMALLGLVIFKQ